MVITVLTYRYYPTPSGDTGTRRTPSRDTETRRTSSRDTGTRRISNSDTGTDGHRAAIPGPGYPMDTSGDTGSVIGNPTVA